MVKFRTNLPFRIRTIRLFPALLIVLSDLDFKGKVLQGKTSASPVTTEYLNTNIVLLKSENVSQVPYSYDLYSTTTQETRNIQNNEQKATSNFGYSTTDDPDIESLTASIKGFRIEDVSKGVSYEKMTGISKILADSKATVRLFGERFTKNTIIRFVMEKADRGIDCDDFESTKVFNLSRTDLTHYSAVANIHLQSLNSDGESYYICAKQINKNMPWVHQGPESWMQIKTYDSILPLWSQIVLIVLLLALSGLFSGLNLGLMSLDRTEMKIVAATGTETERRYAKTIQPLRDNGNYLLCTLLLGNVMVNSTLTILLDDISSGLIAVIGSTISIVLFGEIIPQAICSRHGLAVGARTVWLTKLFMAITFPLSYPISVVLDKILGEEIGSVYNRERLKELIRVTDDYTDLEKDEINIIAGALELRIKLVSDVMTKLEDVFMLPSDAVLDFDTVSEIMSQGYSRVPIYEGARSNLISVLYTKDLAFVDPDDKMPLRTICDFYNNPLMYVFETTTLDVLFREFKTGNKGHMAFAQRINEDESGTDPYYEITGLVTMEDVIEALIQAEIMDETDVYDNMRRRRSKAHLGMTSLQISTRWRCDDTHVSPQLILAAFQYLSTSVEEFNSQLISKQILQRLLNQNLFFQIKVKQKEAQQNQNVEKAVIYERGKAADYFILILEGRVQVEVGRENLMFESGPFSFFGVQILNQSDSEVKKPGSTESLLNNTFIPDYTVRPVVDTTFLKISKSMYIAAKQATVLERTLASTDSVSQNEVGDQFQDQIDKMVGRKDETALSAATFIRRKNSVKVPPASLTGRNGGGRYWRNLSRDLSLLESNQNTFPQAASKNSGNRNKNMFGEILLTPNNLITNYDSEGSNKPLRSRIRYSSMDGERNVKFVDDTGKCIDEENEHKSGNTNIETKDTKDDEDDASSH